jgi:hypothetical protein
LLGLFSGFDIALELWWHSLDQLITKAISEPLYLTNAQAETSVGQSGIRSSGRAFLVVSSHAKGQESQFSTLKK